MKEFAEKLIERLEEEQKIDLVYANEKLQFFNDAAYERYVTFMKAIQIINDLASEHEECALCYLGSPCEYQNKDAILSTELLADNNGWISVEECIGCKHKECKHNGKV